MPVGPFEGHVSKVSAGLINGVVSWFVIKY